MPDSAEHTAPARSTAADIDRVVLGPLLALNFPRAKGANGKPVPVKTFEAGLETLRSSLRYLPPDDLIWLATEVLVMAQKFRAFPPPFLILDAAHRRRLDPAREMRITKSIESMMRSEAGKRALADDCAVEMLREVCRVGHGWKVTERQHAKWMAEAREGRHAEKRRFAREIEDHADAERPDDPRNADLLAAAASRAARNLNGWADLETRAADMVRGKSECL